MPGHERQGPGASHARRLPHRTSRDGARGPARSRDHRPRPARPRSGLPYPRPPPSRRSRPTMEALCPPDPPRDLGRPPRRRGERPCGRPHHLGVGAMATALVLAGCAGTPTPRGGGGAGQLRHRGRRGSAAAGGAVHARAPARGPRRGGAAAGLPRRRVGVERRSSRACHAASSPSRAARWPRAPTPPRWWRTPARGCTPRPWTSTAPACGGCGSSAARGRHPDLRQPHVPGPRGAPRPRTGRRGAAGGQPHPRRRGVRGGPAVQLDSRAQAANSEVAFPHCTATRWRTRSRPAGPWWWPWPRRCTAAPASAARSPR
jgi:hypothetical protein